MMMEPVNTYALTGATVIDGHGGDPLNNATVLVDNGVIKAVGSRKSIIVEDNIMKIDVGGHFILPGLIDAHVHIVGVGSPELLDNIVESNYLQAMRTVTEAGKLLEYGFTTIRSAGSRYDIFLKQAIEEGTVIGPRILACGLALCRSRGHGDSIRRDIYEFPEDFVKNNLPKALLVDGVDEVRKAVRQTIGRNVDHIKFWATGGGAWEKERTTDMHFTRAEMDVIMEEAQMVGLPVVCHAESVESVKLAVDLGVRSIEHADDDNGYELDEEICRKMAEKNIFITPTLAIFYFELEEGEDILPSWIRSLKRAKKNGVKLLLGTDTWADCATPYGKFNITEIKLLVDVLDMTPLEAITSATKYGAEACGIDDKIGTVEKGKLADLLIVKKDPVADIGILLDKENVRHVIKDGRFVVNHP
ncbi:MAG: amidohydrolase family protein [Desulfobacterales bacterium]|nr:amidohydrolase family protein [Desulfobacterales bacterium]